MREKLNKKTVLTAEDIYNIYQSDKKQSELAIEYGVSKSTISRIKQLKLKKYQDVIKEIESKKNKLPEKKIEEIQKLSTVDKNQIILDKIQNLNFEIIAGDMLAILSNYFNPLTLKFIYDNLLEEERFKELLNELIVKIKEVNTAEFYADSIKQLILAVFLQIMKEEYVKKLFE